MKVYNQNSKTANATPSASSMEYGEIAVNYNANNPRLLIKDSDNKVIGFPSEGAVNAKFTIVNNQIIDMNKDVTNNKTDIETLSSWTATPLTETEIKSVFA